MIRLRYAIAIALWSILSSLTLSAEDKVSAQASNTRIVKVFLLAGQSNMEGAGAIKADSSRNDGQGSLEYLAKERADSPYSRLLDKNGEWRERSDVWIHYLQQGSYARVLAHARTALGRNLDLESSLAIIPMNP
ncbi:MAG: sialate O-acetylesterase [Pirellulaceae bacterium]